MARLQCATQRESSGLVRSRRREGLYWTHNDSGDSARLFAIDGSGAPLGPAGCDGVAVLFADHVDWEDLTTDDQGRLYIADTGNNANRRRDLAIYVVPEPDPASDQTVQVLQRLAFTYPDQTEFPPVRKNFDCEAVFHAYGKIHLLTKHRADSHTRHYRLDPAAVPSTPQVAEFVAEYPIGGMVTAADASPDGRRLAVLTEFAIRVFHDPDGTGRWLQGSSVALPIRGGQVEAVTWDGPDALRLTNEQRDIFLIPVADLR